MSSIEVTSACAAASALLLFVILSSIYTLMTRSRRNKRTRARIRQLQQHHDRASIGEIQALGTDRLIMLIGNIGASLARSGLLPVKTLKELQVSLDTAGLRGSSGLGLFIGSKILLLVVMASLGWFAGRQIVSTAWLATALPLGGGLLGMLLPDLYLRRTRQRHLRQVELGLPDALDMLVICSEAGLGLETGIDRVAQEIRPAHAAIAAEMQITATELRISADRRQVLLDMGTRTNLDSLRRLAATLIQTAQFGTPLSQALRMLATEMRQEALTRFEANAARLPVLLTIPMIVFILPCIFVIVGGPAAIQLTDVLGKK